MRTNLYALILILLFSAEALAQSAGDFQTRPGLRGNSASWTGTATWQRYDGSAWVDTNEYPSSSDGNISIGSTINITGGQTITIDQTNIVGGGTLNVAAGATLVIINGEGTDLTLTPGNGNTLGALSVTGTLRALNGSTISNAESKTLAFNRNSVYEHAHTTESGAIPITDWKNGTVRITGYTTNTQAPAGLDQPFLAFIWNTPDLQGTIDLNGKLINVNENLEFINTGNGEVYLSRGEPLDLKVARTMAIRANAKLSFVYNFKPNNNVAVRTLEIESARGVNFAEESDLTVSVGQDMIINGSGPINLMSNAFSLGSGNLSLTVARNTIFRNGALTNPGTGSANLFLRTVQVQEPQNLTSIDGTAVTVYVTGDWLSTGTFSGLNSTFVFNGLIQTIDSRNNPYGNVRFSGSDYKIIDSPLNINGDLIIETTTNPALIPTTLDLSGRQLQLEGDWINTNCIFEHGGGTVILNGNLDQNIYSAGQPFADLQLSNTGVKILQNSDLVVEGNLTISTNDAKLDANENDIYLAGDWYSDGELISGENTVFLNGSVQQTIGGVSPTTFFNLNIESPNVRVVSDQNLKNLLLLQDGAIFDPDGDANNVVNFTLLSDAALTANVGPLQNGAQIVGAMVVQRYMVDKGLIFRYIATPIAEKADGSQPTLADITGMPIQPAGSPIPTIYVYDETVAGDVDAGWKAFPSPTIGPALQPGRGYAVERALGSSDVTLNLKGIVHQGSLSFPVSFTDTDFDDIDDDGWNLLGNPYPSSISWSSMYSTSSNIDPTVWISNHATDTEEEYGYVSFNAEVGIGLGEGASDIIASGQGFWVNAIAENPVLTISESDKALVTEAEFFRKEQPKDVLVLTLSDGKLMDETAIIFREDAKVGYELKRDTYKLKNTYFSLSSLGANQEDLAYNFLPWFACTTEVPLLLDYPAPGEYTFTLREMDSFTRSVSFSLIDNYTGETVALEAASQYNFTITADPKSYGSERFKLHADYAPIQDEVVVQTAQACGSADIKVVLENIHSGVQYLPQLNGEAVGEAKSGEENTLEFMIPASLLNGEAAILSFTAFREGCEAVTLTQTVSLQAEPIYKVTGVSSGIACGTGSVTLSAEGAPEGGSYRWFTSETAEAPEATTQTNTYQTPELQQTQAYYVSILSPAGCESKRVLVTAEVEILEKPVITEQEGLLLASGAGVYQWFVDGVALEGATAAQLEPAASGTYTVQLISEQGCSVLSDPHTLEVLGLEELAKLGLRVWPNPTTGQLQIAANSKGAHALNIRVYSLEGKLILSPRTNPISTDVLTVDISTLHSGTYILEVQDGATKARVRIVKN
ncbi:hemagluttinin repeat-containing protein [Flammeovirgaceae bacterium 311]|nr:hemagluttinin repeat-containing protein [Flammeovirgaceae bacterium 311]